MTNSRTKGVGGEQGAARVLGLDLGTKCGWALLDGKKLTSGTWDLSAKKDEPSGQRFTNFWDELQRIGAVDDVYHESVARHLGVRAAHVYGGFVAILEHWCRSWHTRAIPMHGIPVGTVKKHATGKGNAKKPAMISAAQEKWPKQKVKDDNQADALWILDCGLKESGRAKQ